MVVPTRKREVSKERAKNLEAIQWHIDLNVQKRRTEVVEALKEGASKAQVAKILDINPHQVDTILNPKRRQV
jgi:DNA-directed RNA polymerase subunit F